MSEAIERLAEAAMAGNVEAVRQLLAEDADLARQYTEEGWTALHLAATPEIAMMLLDAGADTQARNRHKFAGPGNSPLHAAVYMNRVPVVRLLIHRGADVNATDDGGFTPLHLAAASGYVEAARTLLGAGADQNVRSGELPIEKYSRKTPLDLLSGERKRDDGSVIPAEDDATMAALLREHRA